MRDVLKIAGREFSSRLIIGTGKYETYAQNAEAAEAAKHFRLQEYYDIDSIDEPALLLVYFHRVSESPLLKRKHMELLRTIGLLG